MKVGEKKRIRFRIYVVALFFLTCLGIVLARAYQLQVLKKDRLNSIARNGYIGTTKLPSKRGTIYDRKGRELALSVATGSIYAHPKQVKDKVKTARQLARILKQRQKKILRLLKSERPFVWIERRIPPDRAKTVKAAKLKGVGVASETKRYYPGKESGAHLIGFVGTDNQGLEGLEKKFDSFLRGPQGSLIQMRDALGRPFSVSDLIHSDHEMHDLILTIDKDIQSKAQEALRSAIKKSSAKGGNCLIVDPGTGEILAMAVVPEFNPNVFSKYKPSQWRNRSLTDCFEPGSTIKAFLLAACLEERVLTAGTRIDCEQGKYKIGNNVVHDTEEHGIMSVSDIIMVSSNIGGVKMGQRLGYGKFCDYLRKFGFGHRIGSDFLGERKGFIRPIEKSRTIDQATLFFGQGMSSTSLQLVMAMAAIANGGKLMRPYVVKAIIDESGHTVEKTRPQMIRRVISKRTAGKVSWILEGVLSDEGTGSQASIAGFRVAGKTGTSQKVDPKTKRYSWSKYVATFVGFVPVDKPKLVILVTIDEPKGIHYGGLVAGPVFRDVGQWSLNYLRINPRTRLAKQKTAARKHRVKKTCLPASKQVAIRKSKDGTVPDFRGLGMREVLMKGRSLGLKVRLEGTGLAVKQNPRPGVALKRVSTVNVRFSPPG
jgi:cell division protein FtsI (penicillin-binding protein 3)